MSDSSIRSLTRSADPADKHRAVRALVRSGATESEAWSQVYGFSDEDTPERETDSDYRRIRIDGELYTVTRVHPLGMGDLHEIETLQGPHFILSESSETAGEAAREKWEDEAKGDPENFTCMVGEDTLVSWALGQPAGPGTTEVCSLDEWLDLWLHTPEEEWASYDNAERDVERVGRLVDELGFTPTVAYRTN